MKIENVEVYGLEQSFRASKFPMLENTSKADGGYTGTVKKLGQSRIGLGHDNFENGIIVQFDLAASNKFWVEMQRYHFIDFVSSQSTMHRIARMDFRAMCNDYVTENTLNELERLKAEYNADKSEENYLRLLYNIPSGFELTARMTTNYRQLKTIYAQRKNHRLPEWRTFCAWIEALEHSELITGESKGGERF